MDMDLEKTIMTNKHNDVSMRQAAIIAGIAFLLSFLGAIFPGVFVNKLIVPEDAATTLNNLLVSTGLYRGGIISWLLVILGDILRAWALYVFLKQVNRSLALLAAWFMLIHDAILGVSLVYLVQVPLLALGADSGALSPDQIHSQILQHIEAFDFGFLLGLFFFSFHLALLGILVYRSGFIPRIFGILLFIAAAGYFINSVGNLLDPEMPSIIWNILAGPCLIGEMALMVWLVIRGGRQVSTTENQSLAWRKR